MKKPDLGGLIKAVKRNVFIKLDTERDRKNFSTLNTVLTRSFTAAMEKDSFSFINHSDFTDELKDVLVSGGRIFTVRYMSRIVGTASCVPTVSERWYHTGAALTLRLLGVLPEYQGRGIGRILLSAVIAEVDRQGLPIILTTPEKNASSIRFYEKNGFVKVQFYWVQSHYTVKMFRAPGKAEPEYIKKVYECIALSSMLRHWKDCDTQLDTKIQKAWNTEFLPYIRSKDSEMCEDMRRCFRRYGISPREFAAYSFDKKSGAQRAAYLSSRALGFIKYEADRRFFGSKKPELPKISGVTAQRVSFCTEEYSESVRAVTVRAGDAPELLFTLLEFRPLNGGRLGYFAGADAVTGRVTTAVYLAGETKCRKSDISPCGTLPDWDSAKVLIRNAAAAVDTTILGFDLVYTSEGWQITRCVQNPSFKFVQQAERAGLKTRLSEKLGYEISTRPILK